MYESKAEQRRKKKSGGFCKGWEEKCLVSTKKLCKKTSQISTSEFIQGDEACSTIAGLKVWMAFRISSTLWQDQNVCIGKFGKLIPIVHCLSKLRQGQGHWWEIEARHLCLHWTSLVNVHGPGEVGSKLFQVSCALTRQPRHDVRQLFPMYVCRHLDKDIKVNGITLDHF